MLSDLCERGECETCFDDELDGCRCECHPTDSLAGLSRPTTEQPSTGGARQAYDPAARMSPASRDAAEVPAQAVPHGAAGKPGFVAPVTEPGTPSSPRRRERAAAAETPGPETAPSPPLLGTGAVRARVPSPAGDALDGARGVPAGSTGRTYTIALPAGMKLLSLNGREHWASRHRRSQALKQAAWALARQAKIPPLGRVAVIAEHRPPDRRHRDADNIAISVKACLDGIVQAGVLPDDECPRYVSKIVCTIGEPYPKGMLVLYLIEVGAATGSDAA